MKFFETSKYHSFKKSTYITLRWIGIIGQLIAVNFVYLFLNSSFEFITSNLVIFLGILSNLYLIFIYKKTQLSDRSAFIFLLIDILQLGVLLYLSGGITNPFVIFILIPSVFSSSNLSLRTNTLLVILTIIIIVFLTFNYQDLPINLNSDFHNNHYFYYSIPVSLIIALVFLNYFAMTFGTQSRLRKEALGKMEEVMAKEHELLSLGGQAAAAAHSLGTPLSTITIISHDLMKQFKGQKDIEKDIELLIPIRDNITVFSIGDEHKIIEKDNFTEIIWKNNSFLDLFKQSSLQDYSKGVIDSSNNLFIRFLSWIRVNFFYPDARLSNLNKIESFLIDYIERKDINLMITTSPPHSIQLLGKRIKNVINLKGKIIQIKNIQKNQYVGYNRTYKTKTKIKVAIIGLGYEDGIPRSLSNKGYVYFKKNRFKIIGRISMDTFTVDISKSSHDLNIGMYLDIINDQHKIDKFAKLCKTIPNEIMTSIGKRVYRKYE